MTTGPGKEHGTNKPPPTRRVLERSKQDTMCPTTSQNPSLWHPSWLNKVCATRKDSESEWLAKDNPETNPITIKPEAASYEKELFFWIPLPYTQAQFPSKISCFVNTCVSSDNSFLSLRQESSFRPWKESSFLKHHHAGPMVSALVTCLHFLQSFCWVGVYQSYSCDSVNTIPPIASSDPMMHCSSLLVLLTLPTLNHFFSWLSSINPLNLPFLSCQK